MSKSFLLAFILAVVTTVASDISLLCGDNTTTGLVEKLKQAKERAALWLEDQQRLDGSWPLSSTKEVIWALQISNEEWYSLEETTRQLGVKQLEIELLAELARNNKANHHWPGQLRNRKMSLGKFAYYINALNSTCHDVSNFYGHNLVEMLQGQMHLFPRDGFNNYFQYALAMLAVCNSGQAIKARNVRILINGQDEDGEISLHSRMPDETAMALMALHCVFRSVNHNIRTMVSEAIKQAESALLSWQNEDGVFASNKHSTALIIQALLGSKEYTPEQWRCNNAVQHLLTAQESSGSFGSIGSTINILPAISGRHFGNLKYLDPSCKRDVMMETPKPATSNSTIDVYLTIQDEVQIASESITLVLTVPTNTSLHGIMKLAQESSSGEFSFEIGVSSWGHFVTTINGIKVNGDKNQYWMLLDGYGNPTSTGMDNIYPEHGEQYVWAYRAL